MTRARSTIRTLLTEQAVVLVADHPSLRSTIQRMARDGDLVAVLPGTYAAAGDTRDATLIRAIAARYPDAVITGAAAAWMTYWPELEITRVDVAHRHRLAAGHGSGRVRFTRGGIPPDLVRTVDGIRFTSPALTALDLSLTHGGDAIHRALRSRTVTVASLHDAFGRTAGRRANVERLQILLDAQAGPWSEAEAVAHRLLRAAGITGWVANRRVGIRHGQFLDHYYLDIAFPALRWAIEIEGHAFHSSATDLNRDRYRQNDLVLAGWRVLRIDWRMLTDDPDYVVRVITDLFAAQDPSNGRDTPEP